jgi:hypothetical protein
VDWNSPRGSSRLGRGRKRHLLRSLGRTMVEWSEAMRNKRSHDDRERRVVRIREVFR